MEDKSNVGSVGPHDHIQGDLHASLTLVEYGDYECPHCGRAYWVVKEVQKKLGKKLRFVFRNFPLTQAHPHAEMAAEAAEAAGAQGRFWEMHDALFENQEALSPHLVLELAKEIMPDLSRFMKDLEEQRFKSKVRQDFMGGVKNGVNGTPTFFVNGSRYDALWEPAELLIKALESH